MMKYPFLFLQKAHKCHRSVKWLLHIHFNVEEPTSHTHTHCCVVLPPVMIKSCQRRAANQMREKKKNNRWDRKQNQSVLCLLECYLTSIKLFRGTHHKNPFAPVRSFYCINQLASLLVHNPSCYRNVFIVFSLLLKKIKRAPVRG